MTDPTPDRLPSCSNCRGWRKEREALAAALAEARTALAEATAIIREAEPWLGVASDVVDWRALGTLGERIEYLLAAQEATDD